MAGKKDSKARKLAKKHLQTLKEVRQLFSDKTRWTTGWFARKADELTTYAADPEAVSFCVRGAIRFINRSEDGEPESLMRFLDGISHRLYGTHLVDVNDGKGYEATLELLDVAIEEAEG